MVPGVALGWRSGVALRGMSELDTWAKQNDVMRRLTRVQVSKVDRALADRALAAGLGRGRQWAPRVEVI